MAGTDVGATLRHARERRGLTLMDVASRTNIPTHLLEAVERNALGELPGGLLTRGHLRAFAAEVGLDGERLISEGPPDSAAEIDLLELMRVRFRAVEHHNNDIIQLVLVVVCIAGFLYVMTNHDSDRTASVDAVQEESIDTPEES